MQWMKNKYPNDGNVSKDCKWYEENYQRIFDVFMQDDFVYSLGVQLYTVQE